MLRSTREAERDGSPADERRQSPATLESNAVAAPPPLRCCCCCHAAAPLRCRSYYVAAAATVMPEEGRRAKMAAPRYKNAGYVPLAVRVPRNRRPNTADENGGLDTTTTNSQ
ncbi:unnamed protein product [Trichogramma brassicae]|uniref:Uncharacterized protein n=1 Tax=Trichogramma brassicae TaxID=86971 RepID=A0A6H5IYD5_9HYME|nr:unnamed protein product [Trichogramma brassicae]